MYRRAIDISRRLVDCNFKTITGDTIPEVAQIVEGYEIIQVLFTNGAKITIQSIRDAD